MSSPRWSRSFQPLYAGLYDDALFLRRVEDVAALPAAPAARWLMLQKLAFVSLNFWQLEYALLCLGVARQIAPAPPLEGESPPGYIRFLAGLEAQAGTMPARYPRTFAQKHSFEQSAARFQAQWARTKMDLSLVFRKEDQSASPVEKYLAEHGYERLAERIRHSRLVHQYIANYLAANPRFDEEHVIGVISWKYE